MPESPSLLTRLDGAVLVVTIRRPDRGNALDRDTVHALIDAVAPLDADGGATRAVLLRSEGTHFCTGADIGGADGGDRSRERPAIGHVHRDLSKGAHRLIEVLWDCPLPLVAELTGRTSGLGLHVALACDFTVTADTATFAEPFADRGFNVDSGGSWLLPRFVGLSHAKRLLFTAETIDAATALDWGLVTHLVAETEVEARAAALAAGLASRPTLALASMKRLLHDGLTTGLRDAMHDETMRVELAIRTDDFKEGMRAFVEKREPEFRGR